MQNSRMACRTKDGGVCQNRTPFCAIELALLPLFGDLPVADKRRNPHFHFGTDGGIWGGESGFGDSGAHVDLPHPRPIDDIKQCATLLGLQVQSVVARVNFLHKETQGLYRTLREKSKKLSSFSSSNLKNNFFVLCPLLHRVVVKHKVWM
jgi:hypothetical protein